LISNSEDDDASRTQDDAFNGVTTNSALMKRNEDADKSIGGHLDASYVPSLHLQLLFVPSTFGTYVDSPALQTALRSITYDPQV
jgi:hypothetical protein